MGARRPADGPEEVDHLPISTGWTPTQNACLPCPAPQLMDQAHPNAASIKGMLDDAAGNFSRGTPSQQQPASQQDAAAGGAAAGASDAGARAEVRERCALLPRQHCNRLVTPAAGRWCTDLAPSNRLPDPPPWQQCQRPSAPHIIGIVCDCAQAGQGGSGGGSSGGEGQKEEAGCDLTRPEYSTGQEARC